MIWILLAAVGVPLWLVVGALAAGLWSRRNFKKSPGVFRAKAQQMSPEQTAVDWSHLKVYGRWVHDVLLLHQGLALVRNRALPVRRLTPSTLDPSTAGDSEITRSSTESNSTVGKSSSSPRPLRTARTLKGRSPPR